MNKPIYLLILLLICLLIPLTGTAQVTQLAIISGDGQTGRPGQTLEPFIVEARDQAGDPVSGALVGFIQDSGSLSNITFLTGTNGQAQTTLTLPRRPGRTTVRAWVSSVRATFEARTIAPTRTTTSTTPSPPPPPEPDPTVFFRILGDNQSGVVGEALAKPFVVRTQDRGGDPLEGLRVVFTVLTGGGSLSAEIAWTDANGRAGSTLTLGSEPGTNTVQVVAHGTSRVITFRAEATLPPVPTTLSIISGDNQTGLTGEPLTNPFVVEVRDENGNPLEGVTVIFAVSAGGGSLSDTSVDTDANGLAQSILILGGDPGTNTIEVAVEGIAKAEIFNAEAALPPPEPANLAIISGDNQTGLTGEPLTNPFVVEVRDQYGDPMAGVTVTFAVSEGDGALSTGAATTDANGRAESTLTLGVDPGGYTVEASVEGVAETVTFNVVAEFLEFDLSLPAGLNLIHVPLKVRAVNGVPTSIESVADLYDVLGGADTLNWLITHDSQTQIWYGYFGEADRGTVADSVLTDQTGILAGMKTPVSVRLGGDALGMDGMSAITLTPGLNLVGLPLMDSRITRVSDLFALGGIGGNVAVIILTDNGEFKLVGRAGDAGDIPVTGGGAFILIVQGAAMIPIIGDGWDNTQ